MKDRSLANKTSIKLLLAVKGQSDNLDLLQPIKLFTDAKIELTNPRSVSGFIETLSDPQYDLIICDHQLLNQRSFPKLDKLRKADEKVPLVTFAHDIGTENLEYSQALKSMHTFILKDLDSSGLHNLIHITLKYALQSKHQRLSNFKHPIQEKLVKSYSYHASIDEQGIVHSDWVSDSFDLITGYHRQELNEKGGWVSCILDEDLHKIRQFNETLVQNKPAKISYRAKTKAGDIIWLESLGEPVWSESEQRVTGIIGGATDITERELLRESIQHNERQQTAITQLAEFATTNPLLTVLLRKATLLVTQVLDAWLCEIFLLSQDSSEGILQAVMGLDSKQVGELKLLANRDNELKYILDTKQSVRADDLRREKRFRPSAHLRRNKALSGICTPIRAGDNILGMLAVYSNDTEAYNDGNVVFIEAIATTVAAFIAQSSAEYQLRSTRQALVAQSQQSHSNAHKVIATNNSYDQDDDEDDISVIVRTAKELRNRDIILSAISSASNILIDASDWETAMNQALAKLGKATNSSRAYIFGGNFHSDNVISMHFEWVNEGIRPLINDAQYKNIFVEKSGLIDFRRTIEKRNIVGHIKDLNISEQKFLKKMKSLSTAIVPIFVEEKWWGFLGFDACNKPRNWSTAEVDALRIAANTISTALSRRQNDAALQAIQEGTVSKTGEAYFHSLLMHLAGIFEAEFTLIAEVDSPNHYKIDYALHKQKLLAPFEYHQKESETRDGRASHVIQYTERVYEKFPENQWLQKNRIEGYLAIPILDNAKKSLGHIAVMSTKPLQANNRELQILQIFAARVAVELERQQIEAENRQLARISLENPNMVMTADLSGNIVFSNLACARMVKELNTHSIESLLPDNHNELVEQTQSKSGELVSVERNIGKYHLQWNYYLQNDLNSIHIYAIDMTQYRIVEEQLRKDAFHDPLTGLPNRNYFNSLLEHAIERTSRRNDYTFAVLFLDLDRFKYINDSLGHAIGDMFLETVAQLLKNCLRPGDYIARLGGDEFAILLDSIHDEAESINIANRVQQVLSEPIQLNQHETFTSASIGIALSSRGYTNPQDILRDADIAMYSAKQAGKARYAMFDGRMHEEMVHVMRLEVDLRHALQNNELVVYYQPIYAIAEKRLAGLEALVRWQHPQRGFLEPNDFIPLAEEMRIIRDIDYLVLSRGLKKLRDWYNNYESAKDIKLHVNLSGIHFNDAAILAEIGNVLKDNKLNNDSLQLELTEGILMDNTGRSSEIFSILSELGVRISIDDFGVGYSSLSRLTKLPVDILKIDRNFVQSMIVDSSSLNITRAVIDLAHDLDMEVIAEGVESHGQYQILSRMGCQYAQGYYISKPMTAEETERFLASPPVF